MSLKKIDALIEEILNELNAKYLELSPEKAGEASRKISAVAGKIADSRYLERDPAERAKKLDKSLRLFGTSAIVANRSVRANHELDDRAEE